MANIELDGKVTDQTGAAKSGLTVELWTATAYESPGSRTASDTTDTNGVWEFNAQDEDIDWIVAVLEGTSKYLIDGRNSIQLKEIFVTNALKIKDAKSLSFGNGIDAVVRWSTGDSSNHSMVIGLGDSNQGLHITDKAAVATDWNISATTHPNVYIHSNTTPATDYLRLGDHDGTTAYVDVVGGTTLALEIAGNTELTVTSAGLNLPANSDINFTGTTGTNDITLTDSLADALSITRGGTDMVLFDSSTPRITFTPVTTFTGTITGPSGTWDSGGVDIAASDSYAVDGTAILSDSSGTMTLSNVDALDSTTEATIEGAIDTLANLVSVGTITTGVWNGSAITGAYINDDIISGQSEITSGLATADELLYSDGGTVKRVGLDTLTTYLAGVNAGTVTSTGLSDSSGVLTLDIQNMTVSTTIADADLIAIDDGAGGTLRKMTRANFIESAALDAINIDGGAIDGAVIGANSAAAGTFAAIAGTTINANTSLTVQSTVFENNVITTTPSSNDTVTMTSSSDGAFSLVTVDASGAGGDITITADGAVDIESAASEVITLDSGAAINLEPASGSAILLDGTISIDAGVVTGATSITSTAFVGALTGNASGTAATVTGGTQASITTAANLVTVGALSGGTIASGFGSIVATTIDATTDFTIGNTILTSELLNVATGGLTIGLEGSAPSPDGDNVHIWDGSAGSVTAATHSDWLVLENDGGNNGMSILGPDSANAHILFGSPASNSAGSLSYIRSEGELRFTASNGVTKALIGLHGLTMGESEIDRSTTDPTSAITLRNGTAPVGTLANGVTLYSASGELLVMDAAGNATTLS